MLKVYDIYNNELKENIDYRIDGTTIIDITGKIHITRHLPEIKLNRQQRRLNKKLNKKLNKG
jgi:hypothetical protein